MLSVSYAGKNAYSAGKTSGVLRGGASGANRCYVLAHCAPPPSPPLVKMEQKILNRQALLGKLNIGSFWIMVTILTIHG